jgi:alpha-beta hydrolase superfamily lysophospholipase
MSKSVMLIHGAWLTPLAWEHFRRRYEDRGYRVAAPPWPLEDAPIEQLRRSPHPELRKLTVGRIVDHYDALVRQSPEPPMIIGHSYGGLIAQKLLDRGLGAAGVALSPAPIRGVIPTPRVLRSALPVFLAPFGWNRVLTMSFTAFAATFAQTLPADRRRALYDRYVVPTPGRIYYQGAAGIGTGIRTANPDRPPLLLIAGAEDLTVSSSMVEATFRRQRRAAAATAFKSFAGRSHFLFAEPGWEEVADFAIAWADEHRLAGTG